MRLRLTPCSASLVTTSARLTAEIRASPKSGAARSEPGSPLRCARMAELSRTMLATALGLSLAAALGDQLIGKAHPVGDQAFQHGLRLPCSNAGAEEVKLALLDPGEEGIAFGDLHRIAQSGGDHDTAAGTERQSQPVCKPEARPMSRAGIKGRLRPLREAVLQWGLSFVCHFFSRH